MKCECCKAHIQGEAYDHRGEKLCEDCYIETLNPPKACDPWAVHSAKRTMAGKDVTQQLSPLQAKIVQFLRERKEARANEVAAAVGIGEPDLRREFATLRHMEVVRATKKGAEILFTLFDHVKQ